jgi:hypothetical protein
LHTFLCTILPPLSATTAPLFHFMSFISSGGNVLLKVMEVEQAVVVEVEVERELLAVQLAYFLAVLVEPAGRAAFA